MLWASQLRVVANCAFLGTLCGSNPLGASIKTFHNKIDTNLSLKNAANGGGFAAAAL